MAIFYVFDTIYFQFILLSKPSLPIREEPWYKKCKVLLGKKPNGIYKTENVLDDFHHELNK